MESEKQSIDWNRVCHLYRVGIFGALLGFIGDVLLASGTADKALGGIEGYLSAYTALSDARLFWSAFLGLVGIPIMILSCFSVYRVLQPTAPKHAHTYRAGLFGYLAFGACGFHVPRLAVCYVYKRLYAVDVELALDVGMKYGLYFMLPALILFMISFLVMSVSQMRAFAKELTPYPKYCLIFSPLVSLMIAAIAAPFGGSAFMSAIGAGAINLSFIWMFSGLLAEGRKIHRQTIKNSEDNKYEE